MRPFALAVLILAAPAAGCGFQPLYAPTSASAGAVIGPVLIDTIPGKAGFALQAQLDQLLGVERGQGPARRLEIRLSERISGVGLRVDESASRSDLTLLATYTLYEADGKVALQGRAQSVASYDISPSAFAEIAAQDDARERAAEALAERIRADLAIRLSKTREASASAAK